MPDDNSAPQPTATHGLNDLDELARFLNDYRPDNLDARIWAEVAETAAVLVMRAGKPTRLRVEKDIQLLGAVVAHLVDRGRPITLEEALSDATLLSFDTSLQAAAKSQENKRGIMRRLQAVHRGLPWRAERRADGARVDNLVSHTEAATMRRLLSVAISIAAEDPTAAAFVATVSAARGLRRGESGAPADEAATWRCAVGFARRHGWHLTRPLLRAAVTHEVLDQAQPLAMLIAEHDLTRRDLDLALTRVHGLPAVPTPAHHTLLRGNG